MSLSSGILTSSTSRGINGAVAVGQASDEPSLFRRAASS